MEAEEQKQRARRNISTQEAPREAGACACFTEKQYTRTIHVLKNVTGRQASVIYLILFYIHASFGFMPFIKFSALPAAKGINKSRCETPFFKGPPTSCKACNQLGGA